MEKDTSAVMLFKCPGDEVIWGISIETVTVHDCDIDEFLADGWYQHPFEARDAHEAELKSQLAENEEELKSVEQEIQKAESSSLSAVHKGRGVWAVLDVDGKEIETGLTKEQAQEKAK